MTTEELRKEYQRLALELKEVREAIAFLGEQLIFEKDNTRKKEYELKLKELRSQEMKLDEDYYVCFSEINRK